MDPLLTFLTRHRSPQDVHYRWWTLSAHSITRQSRQTGRLLLTGIPEPQTAKSRDHCTSGPPEIGEPEKFVQCSRLTWFY